MFYNEMPHYEVLSTADLEVIERGWRRLVSDIGIEFLHPEALELLAEAGQEVSGDVVRFDPDWVLGQVAKAPTEFHVRARNPAKSVVLGGRNMVFPCVSGPPFFRVGDERRDGTLADYELMARMVQSFPELDIVTTPAIEPDDSPLDSRHLAMMLASARLTDGPLMGSALSDVHAEDSLAFARLLHAGHDFADPGNAEDPRPTCSLMTIVNVNSPLRYDTRMLESLLAYSREGQGVIVTPFLLMGAMSPVTIPAALAQQTAEALTGIALMQRVRPGTPAVMGSFLSTIDMRSGSPAFGGPESAFGLYASGQIARRYGLPWRSGGGGLTSSQTVDAQAGYEAFNTLQAAFAAGANLVVQSAGWLESGLVSCPEKLVLDVEILRTLRHQFTPVVVDDDSLAFGAHLEVGPGGHFLGCEHTLGRFRDCFYSPLLSSTDNFERWSGAGAKDAAARAAELWRATDARYEQPALDPDLEATLTTFVARRRAELGD